MVSIILKNIVMSTSRNNQQAYSTVNADEERDMAAKGGPTTSLGIADNAQDVPHPYNDDLQTQIAAKSTGNNSAKNNDQKQK